MAKPNRSGNKDNSIHVEQTSKLKNELKLKDFKWTEKQNQLIDLIHSKECKLCLISGPAGTSKSLISVYSGLTFLNNKRVSEILYTRPILESADASSKLGYLPGERSSKVEPYLQVMEDKLIELLNKNDINLLKSEERIKFLEVNYARGLNIAAKFWLIDEAQGFGIKELITLITRISRASKVIICADPTQSDLAENKQGGFQKLFDLFSDDISKQNGIFTFQFTKEDVLRSDLCKFIIEKIENINKNSR